MCYHGPVVQSHRRGDGDAHRRHLPRAQTLPTRPPSKSGVTITSEQLQYDVVWPTIFLARPSASLRRRLRTTTAHWKSSLVLMGRFASRLCSPWLRSLPLSRRPRQRCRAWRRPSAETRRTARDIDVDTTPVAQGTTYLRVPGDTAGSQQGGEVESRIGARLDSTHRSGPSETLAPCNAMHQTSAQPEKLIHCLPYLLVQYNCIAWQKQAASVAPNEVHMEAGGPHLRKRSSLEISVDATSRCGCLVYYESVSRDRRFVIRSSLDRK